MSAWLLIIKGKPPERAGRRARGLSAARGHKAAQRLIMISKPSETVGRKANGG